MKTAGFTRIKSIFSLKKHNRPIPPPLSWKPWPPHALCGVHRYLSSSVNPSLPAGMKRAAMLSSIVMVTPLLPPTVQYSVTSQEQHTNESHPTQRNREPEQPNLQPQTSPTQEVTHHDRLTLHEYMCAFSQK